MRKLAISLVLLVGVGGCDALVVTCDAYAGPGIILAAVDSISGGPLSSSDVVLSVQESLYVDTLRASPALAAHGLGLAYEREGIYDVQAAAGGYRSWRLDGVGVSADECHVRTVRLTAELQRL
jgi:hypothetical protein